MKLTPNDLRMLEAMVRAVDSKDWDGIAPHSSADWTAIHRLRKHGLAEYVDEGPCQDCDNPKHRNESIDVPIFAPTAAGRAALAANANARKSK